MVIVLRILSLIGYLLFLVVEWGLCIRMVDEGNFVEGFRSKSSLDWLGKGSLGSWCFGCLLIGIVI